MAWGLLAETTYAAGGVTTDLELYEEGYAGAVLPLKLVAPPEQDEGEEGAPFLKPLLVSRQALRLKDDGGALQARFIGRGEQDFRLDVQEQGTLISRFNVLLGDERPRMGEANPAITLDPWDGVTALKAKPYDLSGWITVADLLRTLIDAVGHELDTYVYFNWAHLNQSIGVAKALGIRMRAEDLTERDTDSYYDVLMRLLSFWQLQLVQDAGAWRVMERGPRGNDLDYLQLIYGGGTATGTEDRRVTIDESSIIRNGALAPARNPVPKAVSLFRFQQAGIQNERVDDLFFDSSILDTVPRHWRVEGNYSTDFNAELGRQEMALLAGTVDDDPGELTQTATEAIAAGERISVACEARLERSGVVTGLRNVLLMKVVLTNTADGLDRYMAADGSWGTSSALGLAAEVELGPDPVTGRAQAISKPTPAAGTIRLEFVHDPGTAAGFVSKVLPAEGSYKRLNFARPLGERAFTAEGAASTEAAAEEAFAFGDFTSSHPAGCSIEYLHTDGTWKKASDWGSGKSIHQLRAERRLQQQAQRLSGLDIWMPPSTTVGVSNAIVYGGKVYIPELVKRPLWGRKRRVVAYELRADSVTAAAEEGELGPAPERPAPVFTHSLEDLGDGTLKVYLHAQSDGRTACIEYEYVEGSVVVESGVVPFSSGVQTISALVNAANLLGAAETSQIRAWGWSDYDETGGTGKGLRQLVPAVVDVRPGLTYVPVSLAVTVDAETADQITARLQARGVPGIEYSLKRLNTDLTITTVTTFTGSTAAGGLVDTLSKNASGETYVEYWIERLSNLVTTPFRFFIPKKSPTVVVSPTVVEPSAGITEVTLAITLGSGVSGYVLQVAQDQDTTLILEERGAIQAVRLGITAYKYRVIYDGALANPIYFYVLLVELTTGRVARTVTVEVDNT